MNTPRNGKRISLPPRTGSLAAVLGLMLTTVSAPMSATAVKGKESDPPPEEVVSPAAPRRTAAELLRVLREGRLLPDDDPEVRRRIIEALLEAVDCGGEVLPPTMAAKDRTGSAEGTGTECETATVGGMFAYLRIRDVTAQAVSAIEGFSKDVEYGHYEGIIIDVRYTRHGHAPSARSAAGALTRVDLPIVVLVNRETTGPGEILAASIKEKCGAATVGQATRGFPFDWQKIELASGDVVLLPKVEPKTEHCPWKPTPLTPDVVVSQNLPRSALAKRRGTDRVEPVTDRDLCLRKAVDLLTVIRALDHKHFQNDPEE